MLEGTGFSIDQNLAEGSSDGCDPSQVARKYQCLVQFHSLTYFRTYKRWVCANTAHVFQNSFLLCMLVINDF
jgi:hypothetical protein